MRPLHVEPIADMPPFVRGLAVIRGKPVPVVDLGAVLGGTTSQSITRFATLRIGDRRVALAVEQVLGVWRLPEGTLDQLPPLLLDAQPDLITAVGTLDHQLLLVLHAGRIIPDEVWQSLDAQGATA